MNIKPLRNLLVIFGLILPLAIPVMAQGDQRLAKIQQLANEGKPKEALDDGRKYLDELRAKFAKEPDHPAIGLVASQVGFLASTLGDHEQAVALLREGLPIVGKVRAGRLFIDEYQCADSLVKSLEQLKRTEEAQVILDRLVERTREEIAIKKTSAGLRAERQDGNSVRLDSLAVNEDTLSSLLEKSGMLKLEKKQWPEAEMDLKEADEILKRLHPGEQQVRLVKLREGLDQAARAQGKTIRPMLVGRYSNPRAIIIEGAEKITTEEIYTALTRSSTFILASHPCAEFEGYLKQLQGCIALGYQHSGFPETKVSVSWDDVRNTVVAKIDEGPRFKNGAIRFSGVKAIKEDLLRQCLVKDKDETENNSAHEERAYQKISAEKILPEAQRMKALEEAFPEMTNVKEEKKENPIFPMPEMKHEDSSNGVWETGKWADYRTSLLTTAEGELRAAYAKEGFYFPKIEIKREAGKSPDLVDLVVNVTDEGPLPRLRKIHLVGNRINTREDVLKYLGLTEGMELKGAFVARAKRALYESGRFLGWEFVPRRLSLQSGEIDLLIQVEEEWESPPLFQVLTREQEALLKFATWVNTEAGEKSDLVFSFSGASELGKQDLKLVLAKDGIAMSADGMEHHIRAVGEWGKQFELVVRSDRGSAFRAAFPVAENPMKLDLYLNENSTVDPFAVSGYVGFGAVWSSLHSGLLTLAMDPTASIRISGSFRGYMSRIENGELIVEDDGFILRIDEQSGRLISLVNVDRAGSGSNGDLFTVTSRSGAIEDIKKQIPGMSQGIDNWAEGKSAYSFPLLVMGYLWELLDEEELKDLTFPELSSRAGKRAHRWEPLALIFGDVLDSFKKKDEDLSDDEFAIPLNEEDLMEKSRAGNTMSLLLGMGGYEFLAEYVEPGTWPDLVAREILFYTDGKPFYLNQTIETLLKDDRMGSFGCLLCTALLQKIQHPAAPRFVAKARGELNEKGFAKDWQLLLKGDAKDDAAGWKIFKSLQRLDDDSIDGFLPSDLPELRSAVKELVALTKQIDSKTQAAAFQQVMGSIWNLFLASLTEEMIKNAEEGTLKSKYNPATVAATVNEAPLPRGALNLMQTLDDREISSKLFPISSVARSLPAAGVGKDEGGMAKCATTLIFAQQLWNKGQSPTPQAIDQYAQRITSEMGEDGWDQVEKMGLTKDQYKWWVSVLITAEAYGESIKQNSDLDDKEVREFHERRKDLFPSGTQEAHVHTIRLGVTGDGTPERELANAIHARIKKAGNMAEMVKAFAIEAKEHSEDFQKDQGGDYGWINPASEFQPALLAAIKKIPDQSLGDVIEVEFKGNKYLYLILISEKRRPGAAVPYEQVEPVARQLAILEREVNRLTKTARITKFELPDAGENSPDAPAKKDGKSFADIELIVSKFIPKKDAEAKKPDEAKSNHSEKTDRSLETVLIEDKAGKADSTYFLGTYAERGLAEVNGLAVALSHYERAARGGERRAMLRLSEIYRTGIGVAPDLKVAQEWKEKAAATLKPSNDFNNK